MDIAAGASRYTAPESVPPQQADVVPWRKRDYRYPYGVTYIQGGLSCASRNGATAWQSAFPPA